MNTYLIKRDNCTKELSNVLEKRGNWQEYKSGELDLLDYAGLKYGRDMTYWRKKANIKLGIDNLKNVYNKFILNENILNYDPNLSRFLMFSRKLDIVSIYKNFKNIDKYSHIFLFRKGNDNHRFIQYLKPVRGHSGIGIEVVTDFEDFKQTIKKIIKRNKKNWDKKIYSINGYSERYWSMQNYRAPDLLMLYEGKKFHFRVYFILMRGKEGKKAYIYKNFPLAIARKKFLLNNFKDKEIHDTHFFDKEKSYWLEEYFDKYHDKKSYKYVINQIKKLFTAIANLTDIDCYEESKYCYQILAADMFIYKDYLIKLIELNTSPSFRDKTLKYEDIFEGIVYHLVDPIYPPKNKIKKYNNFIELEL